MEIERDRVPDPCSCLQPHSPCCEPLRSMQLQEGKSFLASSALALAYKFLCYFWFLV